MLPIPQPGLSPFRHRHDYRNSGPPGHETPAIERPLTILSLGREVPGLDRYVAGLAFVYPISIFIQYAQKMLETLN